MPGEGILALWMDCAPGREADFERWYQTEHMAERLAVPGFAAARRFEAIEAGRGCFCYYETEAPEVMSSEPYLARVAAPTALTRTIMSQVMRNMSRTVCRVARRSGAFHGPHAVTMELASADDGRVGAFFDAVAADLGVARAEIWRADEAGAAPQSDEEKLRGGDAKIAACLFVETLREADARRVIRESAALGDATSGATGLYRLVSDLR